MKLSGNRAAFKAYGASVTGSSHIASHRANQDAYGWRDGAEGVEVMALSDGHGGAEHDLSELGSKFAVEVALTCTQALNTEEWVQSATGIKDLCWYFEEPFSQRLQACWSERVREHSIENDFKRYGCTLLMAIRWRSWLVFLQIGDGKIAMVYENGDIVFPIPSDSRLVGNMTFSMSQTCAWAEMKVKIVPFDSNIHTVVLATDGVENAYPNGKYDDADFYLWLASEAPSEAAVETCLEVVERYSKDDSSAVIWRNLDKTCNIVMPSDSEIEDKIKNIEANTFEVETLAGICEWPLNKRIETAYHFLMHLQKVAYRFDRLNTLKTVTVDHENKTFSWHMDQVAPCEIGRIITLLKQLNIELDSLIIQDYKKMKQALVRLQSQIRYDYRMHQFYLEQDQSHFVVQIEGANGPFELFSDSVIHLHQLMPLVGTYNPIVGRIIKHSKHPGLWGFQNSTDHSWTPCNGYDLNVAPNEIVSLKDGMRLWIYGIPVAIRFNNQISQKCVEVPKN